MMRRVGVLVGGCCGLALLCPPPADAANLGLKRCTKTTAIGRNTGSLSEVPAIVCHVEVTSATANQRCLVLYSPGSETHQQAKGVAEPGSATAYNVGQVDMAGGALTDFGLDVQCSD